MIDITRPFDRRIDPSIHSISLADARRPDCPLIYVNKGFEKLTGYIRDEVVGRNCRFLQGARTDRAQIDRLSRAMASGDPIVLDLLNYRKDGSEFWNRLSVKAVRGINDEITHFIGIQSDISQLLGLQDNLETWARDLAGGRQ
jgi:PAS domain S-box-containing protein